MSKQRVSEHVAWWSAAILLAGTKETNAHTLFLHIVTLNMASYEL